MFRLNFNVARTYLYSLIYLYVRKTEKTKNKCKRIIVDEREFSDDPEAESHF